MKSRNQKWSAAFSAMIFFFTICVFGHAEEYRATQPAALSAAPLVSAGSEENWLPLKSKAASDEDLRDHRGKVFKFEGDVKILKKGQDTWVPVQVGIVIEEGDRIITGEKSLIKISYDDEFVNVGVIKEKTKAEFRSIEPTDIHLEDGSVFNVLDGLDGVGYQISTPTAVAAVRGTHFEVVYKSETGQVEFEVFPDGGNPSTLVVRDIQQGLLSETEILIPEGNQLSAEDDQSPMTQENVQPLDIEQLGAYQNELLVALEGISEIQEEASAAVDGEVFDAEPVEDSDSGGNKADESLESSETVEDPAFGEVKADESFEAAEPEMDLEIDPDQIDAYVDQSLEEQYQFDPESFDSSFTDPEVLDSNQPDGPADESSAEGESSDLEGGGESSGDFGAFDSSLESEYFPGSEGGDYGTSFPDPEAFEPEAGSDPGLQDYLNSSDSDSSGAEGEDPCLNNGSNCT